MEGYIKLWRKSFDSHVWANPNLWRFWTWCLMKATFKARVAKVGYQDVYLEPGQFVFGRRKAAIETGLSERKIRTAVDWLTSRQNVTIKTTHLFSIISIVNWAKYQEEATQQTTKQRPTNDPLTTTDKKGKKDKKVKKGTIYGEFKNVKLTDNEYQKLKDSLNSELQSMIERLSGYMESKGVTYKSHYATILNWKRSDDAKIKGIRSSSRGLPSRDGYTEPYSD